MVACSSAELAIATIEHMYIVSKRDAFDGRKDFLLLARKIEKEWLMWPFDQNNHQVYQQYAQAYDTGNYNGFDPFQALGHITQFMQGAPVDMQQRVYQQHFEQMPYEQRVALAQQMPREYYADPNDTYSLSQNFLRMGQEQPHLLQRVFNHPLLLGAAVGLAGLVAKHMLAHHQQNAYGNQQYGGYNQGFQNPGYQNQGYQQDPYNQQNQYQQNPYQQDQYLQQEVNQLRREERELREELREEERSRHHHHREESW